MDIAILQDHGSFLFRWIHFLAGITWIGVLYYFNFMQAPFFAETEPDVKKACTQKLVPRVLWWFRWGAMLTFISGWSIILIYIFPKAGSWTDAYMAKIMPGAFMGTFMWFNVWFIIWPAQKLAIAAANGETPNPQLADRLRRAFLASRTNTLLSVGLLFFMAAAKHLPISPASTLTWYAIVGGIVLIIEINALTANKGVTTIPIEKTSSVIISGIVLALIQYGILEAIKTGS